MTDSGLPARTKRALNLRVIEVSDGNYLVKSESGDNWYAVVVHGVDDLHCGCPDARYRGVVCKHQRAAALAHARNKTVKMDDL